MKKQSSLITYIASLVIGILLLCFHEKTGLFEGIVIAIGVLITVPSALMLISSFISKTNSEGIKQYPVWYSIIVACAGLVLGIWMLVMPTFFVNITIYTLGVVLILVGIAEIVFIATASKPYGGAVVAWYIVPVLVVAGGLIICFLGPKILDDAATIVTGILLIVSGANGIGSLGREAKATADMNRLENKEPNKPV